jgi:hypothetical protein
MKNANNFKEYGKESMEIQKKVGLISSGQPASFVSSHWPQLFDALKEKKKN